MKNILIVSTSLIIISLFSCEKKEPQKAVYNNIYNIYDTTYNYDTNIYYYDNDTTIYNIDTLINEVYSDIITITPSEWVTDGSRIYATKTVNIISANIAENGAVLVYYKALETNEWQALPYTFPDDVVVETFWYKQDTIEIERVAPSSLTPTIPIDDLIYKVVAINSAG